MVTTRSSRSRSRSSMALDSGASASSTAVATPAAEIPKDPSPSFLKRTRRSTLREATPATSTSEDDSSDESTYNDAMSISDASSDNRDDSVVQMDSDNDGQMSLSSSEDDDDFQAVVIVRTNRGRQARRRRAASPEEEPPVSKKPKLPVAEMMPVFSDMKLLIGSQSLMHPSAAYAGSAQGIHDDPRASESYHYTIKNKIPKKKTKNSKCSAPRMKHLEGDLSDMEQLKGLVDPRKLPKDDVDYSRYCRLFYNHPHLRHAWGDLSKQVSTQKIEQPAELKIKLLPFQQEGVWWMSQQERTAFKGGILADEMGMGKTLQTIALLLVNRGKPTLVICPTVALLQWKAEIELATDALSVLVYYGNDRRKIINEDGAVNKAELAKYDVVLTTYAVMESGFRRERQGFRQKGMLRKETSVLHTVDWFRIVMDEAHNLKDRSSNSARAAFLLKAQHTWSLTGTPLHNRVGELYSLIRLTKVDPFSMYFCHECECKSLHWNFTHSNSHCSQCGHLYTRHFCYWNLHVLKPIQTNLASSPESRMGFKKLGKLLDNVMLRRTKVERAEDLGLPPRIVVTRRDKFNPAEEDYYMSLFTDYQREFDTYAHHGTVLNNYANIFELITRMRLAANHPDLLRLKIDSDARVGADESDTLVCTICNEEAEDPIMSRCKHVFCRVDAQMYINSAEESAVLRCPMCYALFEIDLTQPEMNVQRSTNNSGEGLGGNATLMETMMSTPRTTEYRRSIVNRIDMKRWRSSTKIEALVEELSKHRQGNANIKSIVFSQFVNFLDLIQWRLNRAGFSVCRLDGRMSPAQRNAVIQTFMTQPEYTVFLVSLKAGGVALNLTEASNVYLADCWWNPSVEVQAMDRIHRMGQYRPIKVTRIIVENSIESRIVALQVKKQMLVNSTIGRDKKSLDNLSAQDMQFLFSS
ncbi:DNA repair protein rad16 [Coemansia spiralis]|uniref:DNA repair protein rad16 n=2 Tax=Coemansia TaxID=4863 RepID=A0A9W8G2M0_9FUNG|nr:SNF2 family N-terminal domain-containing protein [Coemansia spiralis]KAJ1987013.1 DNA repair protein rad16 [Coemansia umbellata]KAJ2619019.1 DNA repair protein rad16 [Coemansia sp. RSA 1358]KAJ2672062.1 DNA repair protein rad16 [Coemansia spiralis]